MDRSEVTAGEKLDHFISGLSAAVQLAQRAAENGFLVEYIVLSASVVDAALRMGLILQHQIDTRSTVILDELLRQADGDSIVSEREVYRRALQTGVIPDALFHLLQDLYLRRNRVVHRYIISEITTADVFEIARGYEDAVGFVNTAVGLVEERQIELGVGMTVPANGESPEADLARRAAAKHGAEWLARAFSRLSGRGDR